MKGDDPNRSIDDKTWGDLEFPTLFSRIDTTMTVLGRQVLYHRLRTRACDSAELDRRYALYERLRHDRELREAIQLQLAQLDRSGAQDVCRYLFGTLPEPGRYRRLLQLWAVLSIAVIGLALPLSLPAWLFVPVLAINFGITLANMGNVHWQIEVLTNCTLLAGVAKRLATLSTGAAPLRQLDDLAREKPRLRTFNRGLRGFRWMLRMSARGVPVAEEIAGMVKALLLVETLVCGHAMKRFARVRGELANTFERVGELDAAIAVASWLDQVGVHCRPELVDDARMAVIDGVHPLIANGVPNSIRPGSRSVLVTGSNMAGKTTFIKMLGINMILGRTLGVCTASAATVPDGRVMASIHNQHSVAAGESNYFAEIEAIKMFLLHAPTPGAHLFLIDEPFSGTNTVERIAIARAVLEALGRNARVFATTHDVELQRLLPDAWDLCHFQENPDVDGFFDYRLKPGATHEHNAIRLLERVGFPLPVVQRAMALARDDATISTATPTH